MVWISEGLTALISGMSAVFMILIMISFMISGLGQIGKLEKKPIAHRNTPPSKEVAQSLEDDLDERRRIVAAIASALAEQLNVRADQLIVRKLRRL